MSTELRKQPDSIVDATNTTSVTFVASDGAFRARFNYSKVSGTAIFPVYEMPHVGALAETFQSEPETDESEILEQIRLLTPSNDQLLQLAEDFPPPQSWYEEEG